MDIIGIIFLGIIILIGIKYGIRAVIYCLIAYVLLSLALSLIGIGL